MNVKVLQLLQGLKKNRLSRVLMISFVRDLYALIEIIRENFGKNQASYIEKEKYCGYRFKSCLLKFFLAASFLVPADIGCIALNARQHGLRDNLSFRRAFHDLKAPALELPPARFGYACQAVSNSGFYRTSRCRGVSRSASMFYWIIDWFKRVTDSGCSSCTPPW